MSTLTAPETPDQQIATWLAVRLIALVAASVVATALAASVTPILAWPIVLLVNLLVLWYAVHFVFAALDMLLETKVAKFEA